MKNKLMALALSALVVSQMAIPVSAATNTVTQTGPVSVPLTASVESSFEITVPKTIELTKGETKTFDVKVKGDIAGTEVLTISLGSTVTMSQEGKDSISTPVSIAKSTFSCSELAGEGKTTQVTVNGANLSAGDWTGSCSLTVSLN